MFHPNFAHILILAIIVLVIAAVIATIITGVVWLVRTLRRNSSDHQR